MAAMQIMTKEGVVFDGTERDLLDLQTSPLDPFAEAAVAVTDELFMNDPALFDRVSPYLLGEAAIANAANFDPIDRQVTKELIMGMARQATIKPIMARHCLSLIGLTPPAEQNSLPLVFSAHAA